MYHNEVFHKDSFGSAPVGRTFQRSVLRQNAEMYVTCTVLNKGCLLWMQRSFSLDRPPVPTLYHAAPKSGGTLSPTPPRLRRPCGLLYHAPTVSQNRVTKFSFITHCVFPGVSHAQEGGPSPKFLYLLRAQYEKLQPHFARRSNYQTRCEERFYTVDHTIDECSRAICLR